ncbi:hypothetical protein EDM00_09625 [Ornithobacterium rhinotracheale]|uniref:hypothetical protein n=1 Tax=Ornithobacterium rhinotracheale TaxID=28251 RepID=UPI00129CE803|nr:hypothetical protein [Ornithobacterium rhinotracheale]MRI64247.1 hypothetical protein [Ornithobacterium rhinotracheale]
MKNDKTFIKFRIAKNQKKEWQKRCSKKGDTLTDFIIQSVENRMLNSERREILKFIEKQDNIFAKIENNINQFAKIANGQKFITPQTMLNFNEKLAQVAELKKEQNKMFERIYKLLSHDS